MLVSVISSVQQTSAHTKDAIPFERVILTGLSWCGAAEIRMITSQKVRGTTWHFTYNTFTCPET
jgi:hypothetical protein